MVCPRHSQSSVSPGSWRLHVRLQSRSHIALDTVQDGSQDRKLSVSPGSCALRSLFLTHVLARLGLSHECPLQLGICRLLLTTFACERCVCVSQGVERQSCTIAVLYKNTVLWKLECIFPSPRFGSSRVCVCLSAQTLRVQQIYSSVRVQCVLNRPL